MELDADLALELWDIFAASVQPKEKSIVAESYANWLLENGVNTEELEELARQDSTLATAISLLLADDEELEDPDDE